VTAQIRSELRKMRTTRTNLGLLLGLVGLILFGVIAGSFGSGADLGLVENQRGDGTWDEPEYTGTGFPGDFYINYHLYRLSFPVMALGRWAAAGEEG